MDLNPGIVVPLGAFVMVIIIVALASIRKTRLSELDAHRELRMREMEHERKMKELEIEKARLEVERLRAVRPS